MFQPQGFEQRSINTSLGKMVYYTATGSPWQDNLTAKDHRETLVFLHGFGGGSSAYEWSKVYPAFAGEYRILAPDLIGWGRSDHPVRNYMIDDYLTTIREFCQQTCTTPVKVIASSLTAALTIRVAIAHPELFQSLILVTPSGLSDFGQDYSRSLFAQIVSVPIIDRVLYSTGIATSGGIRNFLEQRQFAQSNRIYEEIVEAYLQSAQQPNAEYAALSFVRGDLCFDLSLYIQQLQTPTGMIWGEKSEFTGPELGRRLAGKNPQAIRVFQELENVGLTPHLELPAVTVGLIRQFLLMLN
ncbi:alpha/beta fold hydrolase [Umezakia ovalisporum]|uniref:alpha/beta fold hydrolase n=1 Tax=Umezakia ovalisporum TaxID=75695 RepID=UPI0006F07FC5|nr:alpha/beta hydrolase [Umezakia ovalisporum]MBI1242785.1 alpha/beta fold hydrolase [Nostoc sp. RI_552]MDH6085798.1 alpha/beta hydrolase [Umezakia ovalisporum TAC611]MDH6090242.1 alpha/beta hydrolase [Umezakia ovalisporum Ak1311]CEJ47984.1 Alpha/beta hydrolase fold protein (Putative alpha /beta hydrolase superfamily, sll0553-like protein) [Umezakia ovalisporum]